MATPIIRSSGTTSGVVTGDDRNNLVIAEIVTLTDTQAANAGANYQWLLEDRPIGSNAAITNPTSATASFTPDQTGTYRIRCTVNGVSFDIAHLAVPLPVTGMRIPSFKEDDEFGYTVGGVNLGWHEAMTVGYRAIDSRLGLVTFPGYGVIGNISTIEIGDAAVAGGLATVARADHQHAFAAPSTVSDVSASAGTVGSSNTVARADHTHYHGALTGAGLHALATTSTHGFMAAADKAATILTVSAEASLANSRRLAAGTNVTFDTTVGGVLTINATGGGGGGGAPTDADYIVATTNGSLSAERVATSTATISVDMGTAGQAKWNVIDGSLGTAKLADVPARSIIANSGASAGPLTAVSSATGNNFFVYDSGSGFNFREIAVSDLPIASGSGYGLMNPLHYDSVQGLISTWKMVTWDLESNLGNHRRLAAGTGVTFDISVGNVLTINATGGGGGAPTTAEYIVGALDGSLSAERVATATATISVDLATAGQAKWDVIDGSLGVAKLATIAGRSLLGKPDTGVGAVTVITSSNDSNMLFYDPGTGINFRQVLASDLPNASPSGSGLMGSSMYNAVLGMQTTFEFLTWDVASSLGNHRKMEAGTGITFDLTVSGKLTINASGGGVTDHGALTGLGDDDHSIYALLAGRSGGQTLVGGTGAGDDLTLSSTSHGTKGTLFFGSASAYDEVNQRLGIGVTAPTVDLVISKSSNAGTVTALINNTHNASASSHAKVQIETGGTSSGSPVVHWKRATAEWIAGIDGSTADARWKLQPAAAFSATPVMSIFAGTGSVSFGGDASTSPFARQLQLEGTNATKNAFVISGTGGGECYYELYNGSADGGIRWLQVFGTGYTFAMDQSATSKPLCLSRNDLAGSFPAPGTNDIQRWFPAPNIDFFATGNTNFQSMVGGFYVKAATTAPTGNPASNDLMIYVEGGKLKLRDPSGIITIVN